MSLNHSEDQSPLRILHIMSGFGGGISSFILNKAKEMPQYKITFDVVTYDECSNEFVEAIQATGGDVYQLMNPKRQGWRAFKRSLTNVLKLYHYDQVHCHIDGYRALAYWYLCKRYNLDDFYIHAHQSYQTGNSIWRRLSLDLNQKVNRSLSKAYLGCGKLAIWGVYGKSARLKEMMMVPNSIAIEDYADLDHQKAELKRKLRDQYKVADSDFVIGQISRFEAVKNHDFTLKIASYMEDKQLPGRILLAGLGNRVEEIQEAIKAHGLEDRVTYLGRLSPIQDYYPAFDVMILPSLYEGLPTVVVESQAAGLPVVMADTITKEVDLGLHLVECLSLDSEAEVWYEALAKMAGAPVPPMSQRKATLEAANFSNQTSAKLYAKFLRGDINNYII